MDNLSMKATPCYLLLILIVCGCTGAKAPVTKLPSGNSIEVLGVTAMHFSNGPPALMLKYQTAISIQDTAALRKEAGEVWDRFRPDVEQKGFKNAILSANDAPKGFIFSSN